MEEKTSVSKHKDDLASLSIRRPVLTLVINLLIALAGIAALQFVEIRELPDVDRPIVSIRGVLPGASPETLDAEVTSIVEGAVARVSGVKNIRSSSEENNFRIHAEFSPTVDLEQAASDIREAVNRVERQLPDSLEQLTVIKADNDADPVISIAVTSQSLNKEELTYKIEKDIVPQLMTVDGVADASLSGESERVLRVVIDPLRLSSFKLTIADVISAVSNAPLDIPSGSFKSIDQELLVRVDASAVTEEQIKNIVIADETRIVDIAEVYFGPKDAASFVYFNNEPVIGIDVIRQSSSNTIKISDRINQIVKQLNAFHSDLKLTVIEDSAVFIKGSVKEVITSLCYTILIVILIIWLFFGSWRITLIPCIVIPIALVGTISVIAMLGFSINTLTLLAIVLATGLVVDDAIVVLENIQRYQAAGVKPRAASVLGTRQVIFAVLATTAVLISVFIPIGLMPSTTGLMFREFGFVLGGSVLISSFVALTLVPVLATLALAHTKKQAAVQQNKSVIKTVADKISGLYQRSLGIALNHSAWVMVLTLFLSALAAYLYTQVDQELIPKEDRGVLYADATGPDGVGLDYMERQAQQMEAILQPIVDRHEAIGLYTNVGRWDPNRVRVTLPLVHWENRSTNQQDIIKEISKPLSDIPGVNTRVRGPNSLNIRGAGSNVKIALIGNNYDDIYAASLDFADAISSQLENLSKPGISYQPTQPQLAIEIDRLRAANLDIPLENIATILKIAVDGLDVIDLNVNDENIPLYLTVSRAQITSPEDLTNLFVSNRNGDHLPLSSVITFREESIAAELDRHVQRRAVEIVASLEPGYPIARAVDDLRQLAETVLPPNIDMILLDEAARIDESGKEANLTYILAFVIVFLVLCAQFEGFISALIVLVTIPFGFAAAIFALYFTGTSMNLFSQIGFILLIGVMAKNGILLVEFADQLRDRGSSVKQAIAEAAAVRFRPILLTMLSTVLAGLPLILSSGPGSEAREAIGWVMFGGLGIAALFTLYLTPALYMLLAHFQKPRSSSVKQLEQELNESPDFI